MPSPAFTFTVTHASARALLTAMRARAMNVRRFWIDVFAPAYFADVQDLFALEGQSRGAFGHFGGGHWMPLTPHYAAWKERHFPGKRILERTGRLKASLTWNGTTLGPEGYFHPGPRTLRLGTDVPYGRFHQHGTPRMVARPFLPPPAAWEYSQLLRTWIRNAREQESAS